MKRIDDLIYIIILQFALISMTGIDYIVHSILYRYGLLFSYDWAVPYWILLGLTFFVFGLIGLSAYRIDRRNYSRAKAFMVFITIEAEYLGGFLDTLWFIINKLVTGQPIDWIGNWWWHSYSKIFGIWNMQRNIILNVVILIVLLILWKIANRNLFKEAH